MKKPIVITKKRDDHRLELMDMENKKLKRKIKQLRKWLRDSNKIYKKEVELKLIGTYCSN